MDDYLKLKHSQHEMTAKSQSEKKENTEKAVTPIARQLENVPLTPGVYLFKDDSGKILYVGKARHLRKRVRSYFQTGRPHDSKTRVLLEKVISIETIITHTEKEAFILEYNFVVCG